MKVYVAHTEGDDKTDFREVLNFLKAKKNVKTFLIGEESYRWEEVDIPVVKPPKERTEKTK